VQDARFCGVTEAVTLVKLRRYSVVLRLWERGLGRRRIMRRIRESGLKLKICHTSWNTSPAFVRKSRICGT
jgi:hypothetical protein